MERIRSRVVDIVDGWSAWIARLDRETEDLRAPLWMLVDAGMDLAQLGIDLARHMSTELVECWRRLGGSNGGGSNGGSGD